MIRSRCFCLVLLLYVNFPDVDCGVTQAQLDKTSEMVRSVCQPRSKVSTELADGIGHGQFPDDRPLKCYMHCVLEMTGIMKKNKVNYEASLKQMEKLLPDNLLADNKHAITVCKDNAAGVKNACDVAYIITQCLYNNNKQFKFA